MKIEINEREWQRKYAETFYDNYVYTDKTVLKKEKFSPMALLDYAYNCAKENYSGNENVDPINLAGLHVTQSFSLTKEAA